MQGAIRVLLSSSRSDWGNMDFRKHKEEDAAGKVRQVRTWDASLAALPTSYARLARAARSLGDLGIAVTRSNQLPASHEQGIERGPGERGPGARLEIVA